MVSYSATRDSLDEHRAPEWSDRAKFDVFVHYSPTWFDADEWADLPATAGARYLVFTTKHHDGFSNWPTAHSEFAAEDFFSLRDRAGTRAATTPRRGRRPGRRPPVDAPVRLRRGVQAPAPGRARLILSDTST